MIRPASLATLLLCAAFILPTSRARAEKLFDFSGKVALLDGQSPGGVTVKVQADLNRNRELESFETVTARVSADGSYKLSYELDPGDFGVDLELVKFATKLIAAYNERGFEALLDKGPLPVMVSFQREGYTTIIKRFTTLDDAPSFDVVLAKLRDVQCAGTTCLSADGSVEVSGFPGGTGIARAYAQAFDPGQDTPRFPGNFSDDDGNLLQSSGFAEINMYDEDGNEVHELSSPVKVRFEAKPASWPTLPDLKAQSGKIELPMYSFERASGEWVREADGELQREDGTAVAESELAAIHDGSFSGRLYISFATKHFSSFNCDEPIDVRACVKGRLVNAEGSAVVGAQVTVEGVSYTGNAGTFFSDAEGRFAADVFKSEGASEDVDGNGKRGETFQARVTAIGTGIFTGEAFATASAQGSVQLDGGGSCRPSSCSCPDLGDITVDFETPRSCEVSVAVQFSGNHTVGDGGPLEAGSVVASAEVSGQLNGAAVMSPAFTAELCAGQKCNGGKVAADGTLTFIVPVVGDAPELNLNADLMITEGDTLHYYSGSVTVAGCTRAQTKLDAAVEIQTDHAAVTGIGEFIATLGAGPSNDPLDPINDPIDDLTKATEDPLGCGCRVPGAVRDRSWYAAPLVLLGLAFTLRRRRNRVNRKG
jgi:MYXO-CTERM domain-containing protein